MEGNIVATTLPMYAINVSSKTIPTLPTCIFDKSKLGPLRTKNTGIKTYDTKHSSFPTKAEPKGGPSGTAMPNIIGPNK